METQDIVFISILASFAILYYAGLWKVFEKANEKGWKAIIPIYNSITFLKIIGKNWYNVFYLFIPGINIVFFIFGMLLELYRSFGKEKLSDQLLGIFFFFAYVFNLGFSRKEKYIEPAAKMPKYKKSQAREWADAILFAVIAATVIRWLLLEAFKIPTPSMERSLLMGDFLFVSKVNYGARTPQTPLQAPLTHQTWWWSDKSKSYLDWIQLPQYRLPGLQNVKNNDVVVFNWPADEMHDPVDLKTNYIKRCIAIAGDTLVIKNKAVFINGKFVTNPPKTQYKYKVYTKEPISSKILNKYEIPNYRNVAGDFRVPFMQLPEDSAFGYVMDLTEEIIKQLIDNGYADSIKPLTKSFFDYASNVSFQRETTFPFMGSSWNVDNYGPLWIPKKGSKIILDKKNIMYYGSTIGMYEGHDKVEIKSDPSEEGQLYRYYKNGKERKSDMETSDDITMLNLRLFIDGKEVKEYTFKRDYYFMMGDNRHSSYDSRYWGFVPDNFVVGKALFIWFSMDPDPKKNSLDAIRWNRLFNNID